MEIKRIQLRGISRSPSDKMTEDGGIAESLNAYLDSQEVAPAIVPEDVTHQYMPDNVQAKKVFLHKVSNAENIILVTPQNEIVFFKNNETRVIASLDPEEEVVDVTSLGNTVIVSTNRQMLYILLKKGEYIPLGNTMPKVYLGFVNVDQRAESTDISEDEDEGAGGRPWKNKSAELQTANSAALGSEGNDYIVTNEYGLEVLAKVWETYQEMIGHNLSLGLFNAPIMIRYAVRLYDDTYLEASSPIMLGGTFNNGDLTDSPLKVLWKTEHSGPQDSTYYNHKVKVSLCYPYKVGIYKTMSDVDLENWRDLIQSIDVYITPAINLYPNGSTADRSETQEADADGYNRRIILDPKNSEGDANIENTILSNGTFFKVKSFSLEEISASSPTDLITLNGDMRGEAISTNTQFSDKAVSTEIITRRMDTYNNSVLSHGAAVALSRGLPTLNGQCAHRDITEAFNYAFRYYIPSSTEEDYVIYSKNIKNPALQAVITPDQGTTVYYTSGRPMLLTSPCAPFAFLSYPDSRCYKVDICKVSESGTELGVCTIEMKPHPTVANCSYAWLGLNKSLASLDYNTVSTSFTEMEEENRLEQIDNKLFVSAMSNPFSFPIANRFTFQSAVLGTAVATAALSQGQFGDYPLYVFTKDGIWAMQTNEEGRFLSPKPLSRDVCSNVESITSLDKDVAFVTSKGVMLLHGSEVVELSPYMNGKHYTIEPTAKVIVEGQDFFCGYAETLSDSSPFMAFVQKASTAYDYAGKRLIFINPSEDYQYVYKLDTQTWHKLQHPDFKLQQVINSYPECLVVASADNGSRIVDMSTHLDVSTEQKTEKVILATRPFDLSQPDVFKTIKDVRIRGQFPKGAVKFILLGSLDGINFRVINTLRGKSWKLFRLIILADLDPTDRISWVDIGYETRFTNRLR